MTFESIVENSISQIVTYIVTILSAACVVIFIWGVVKYLFKGDSDEARQKGRRLMIWGIIALFVIFGIWGILEILTGIYGGNAVIPQFGDPSSYPSRGSFGL
jgi:predicted permease